MVSSIASTEAFSFSCSYGSAYTRRYSQSASFQISSVCSLTTNGSKPKLPDIFYYTEKKRWRKVKSLLHLPDAGDAICRPEFSGLTLLSFAVACSAPVQILQLILQVYPPLIHLHDMYGATALHIACLNGSSVESVQFLILCCPDLVQKQDIDGRLPIHHVGECVCRDETSLEASLEVIKANLAVTTDILFVQDKAGNTVMDLIQDARCIETNTEEESRRLKTLYTFLKKECIRAWKVKKESWEQDQPDNSIKLGVLDSMLMSYSSYSAAHDSDIIQSTDSTYLYKADDEEE